MMLSVDERSFSQVVLNSPNPVLVHFWAPWCGLCRLVVPLLTKVQGEWEGNLKIVSINADDNFRLANTFRLKSLPTLLLFEQGQIIHRMEDFQNREDLQAIIEQINRHCFVKSA